MKKHIMSLALSAVILAGSMNSVAYASPQKPFAWRGWIDNYTFDWNDDTAVEMKNGDGTDVLSVSGQYIIDHMLPGSTWPLAMPDGSLPKDVKNVSCQVVKEDAYIIMPFDGYVVIGIEDAISAASGDICVRAKAGDKVNIVPKNLVPTHENEMVIRDSYAKNTWMSAREKEQMMQYDMRFIGTTADDWTYTMKIYKEAFVPMTEQTYNPNWVESETNELISLPMYKEYDGPESYAFLWYIYQVDAPDTEIRAMEIDQTVRDRKESISCADIRYGRHGGSKHFDGSMQGWIEDPIYKGVWRYMIDGYNVMSNLQGNYFEPSQTFCIYDGLYSTGLVTIQDNEVYLDGRRMNVWRGTWTEPEYELVNVQNIPVE